MKKVLGFLLGCCITASAFAQQKPAPLFKTDDHDNYALIAQLSTSRAPNHQLWLEIQTGPVVTKALRAYSVPSNTLIAVIVDAAFSQTVEGQKWLASFSRGNVAITFVRLPNVNLILLVPDFPATDEGVRFWVNGDFFGNRGEIIGGGYGMGPAHIIGGIYYFEKESAEEFKLELTESNPPTTTATHTSGVEQTMSCDSPPVHWYCCPQSQCSTQCIFINIHSLANCCENPDTGACDGPYCPTQICRDSVVRNPSSGPVPVQK